MNGKFHFFHNEGNQLFVSGLELHRALKCQTPYRKWFRSNYRLCGVEGTDYFSTPKHVYSFDGRLMPQKQHDHYVSINMAKCVSLLQTSETGKECYDYLQMVSDNWKKLTLSHSKQNTQEGEAEKLEKENQALREKVRRLEIENLRLHVKADFFDALFPAGIEMPIPGVLACHTDDGSIFYDMLLKTQNSGKTESTVH